MECLVQEEMLSIAGTINPGHEVVNAHNHLFLCSVGKFEADAKTANVMGSIYAECGEHCRSQEPSHIKPAGETEFIAASVAEVSYERGGLVVAGILGTVDLRQDPAVLEEVLAKGRFART